MSNRCVARVSPDATISSLFPSPVRSATRTHRIGSCSHNAVRDDTNSDKQKPQIRYDLRLLFQSSSPSLSISIPATSKCLPALADIASGAVTPLLTSTGLASTKPTPKIYRAGTRSAYSLARPRASILPSRVITISMRRSDRENNYCHCCHCHCRYRLHIRTLSFCPVGLLLILLSFL